MLQDTPTPRRSYSPQFKACLVDACERPGASVAALAREHGINANVLHRWSKEHRQRMQSSDAESAYVDHHDIDTRATTAIPSRAQTGAVVVNSTPAFVAIDLELPALRTTHAVRPEDAVPTPAASPHGSPPPAPVAASSNASAKMLPRSWTMFPASSPWSATSGASGLAANTRPSRRPRSRRM